MPPERASSESYRDSYTSKSTSSTQYVLVRSRQTAKKKFARVLDGVGEYLGDTDPNMEQNVTVGPELRDSVKELFKGELQASFDVNIHKIITTLRETISQELRNSREATTTLDIHKRGAELENRQEIDILEAKNASLQEENEALKKRLDQAQQAANIILKDTEQKARKLHKIIIDSGLNETGPTDEQIEKAFGRLRHTIFQFVMKHCTNYNSKAGLYGALPSEAKNWWVVQVIALQLYKTLFDHQVKFFGFNPETNVKMRDFEASLLSTNRAPYSETVEWRVRTCQLSRFWGTDLYAEQVRDDLVPALKAKLGLFWHHPPESLKKRTPEIRSGLEDIYFQAVDIALLFRRSKTEYRWLHKGRDQVRELTPEDVEVVASAGHESFEKAGKDFRTAFGEVVKGAGPSGLVQEEIHILTKCMVILGPFN